MNFRALPSRGSIVLEATVFGRGLTIFFLKYKACSHAYGVYDIKIGKYEEPFFSLVFVVTGDIIRRGWLSYDLSREVTLLIVI